MKTAIPDRVLELRRPPMRVAFLIGFGLLPLWLAIALMVAGARGFGPWPLLIALPASVVSFGIALVADQVYHRTQGTRGRKAARAGGFIALACVVLGGVAVSDLHNERDTRAQIIREMDEIKRMVAARPDARQSGSTFVPPIVDPVFAQGDALPTAYIVTAGPTYLLVDVDRAVAPVSLRIRCVNPTTLSRPAPREGCPK